ncbi:J domain-containing protein [Synechococcus sp. CS-1325]|nr:J domain-containing protein [Synechococcus sp. CS-1325]MCT0213390.1 J domain-containing protein [Synechococcus sp. CS-1326]MCT0231627.1 J domain-containing protein [Synechococcus sp. CS-1324]MCT0232756.1 J domain-containing protein [Synechococcus sp. CS-1327]PZV01021.1 MAG: molecular chaperone DnaJ [Cyanobium sp.]
MAGRDTESTPPNHYQLLRLGPSATAQDLRQAFRSLSKLYHPDTTKLPVAEAEEQFRHLQLAYLTLSDPERRRAYDSQLLPVPAKPLLKRRVERTQSVRRALSGGEWFALVLLATALVLSLVLGVSLAWWRGMELVSPPISWLEASAVQTALPSDHEPGDDRPALLADPALQPSPAGP